MTKNTEITALIEELESGIGLTRTDAYRSAFVVLALRQNWSKARIGRYLGVTRARATQRAKKLAIYAEDKKRFPQLAKLMKPQKRKIAPNSDGGNAVSFEPSAWEDERFALGMLERVA